MAALEVIPEGRSFVFQFNNHLLTKHFTLLKLDFSGRGSQRKVVFKFYLLDHCQHIGGLVGDQRAVCSFPVSVYN